MQGVERVRMTVQLRRLAQHPQLSDADLDVGMASLPARRVSTSSSSDKEDIKALLADLLTPQDSGIRALRG